MKVPGKDQVLAAVPLALPLATREAADGYWELVSGWNPASASVVVEGFDPSDKTGGSARSITAAITVRFHDGDPKVHRHAADAFAAYVGTYGGNRQTDPGTARSAIAMAVGKIAKRLRADGFTVGVACPNVGTREDPHYVVVPFTY
jgi:hypothetical protein